MEEYRCHSLYLMVQNLKDLNHKKCFFLLIAKIRYRSFIYFPEQPNMHNMLSFEDHRRMQCNEHQKFNQLQMMQYGS